MSLAMHSAENGCRHANDDFKFPSHSTYIVPYIRVYSAHCAAIHFVAQYENGRELSVFQMHRRNAKLLQHLPNAVVEIYERANFTSNFMWAHRTTLFGDENFNQKYKQKHIEN